MFIKLNTEKHLNSFMSKGDMFFNPCGYYRDLEKEQMKKGIGDGNDGGVSTDYTNLHMFALDGKEYHAQNGHFSFVVEPALTTPVFCLRKSDSEYISKDYREKLRIQFPEYTHALIIRDESQFMENVRYNMRNKAFAHTVFYEDKFTADFFNFMLSGSSDISFYDLQSTGSYYMEIRYQESGSDNIDRLLINDANYYKTMYRKSNYFRDQKEYRFVLPYEHITKGRVFNIDPFHAELYTIDDLVK